MVKSKASAKMDKYGAHLNVLVTATPEMTKAIIKAADNGLINCLCECSYNVLKGNVPLTPSQMNKLSQHKTDLRKLAEKKTSIPSKKRILQKGGFLSALLGPLLGLIGPGLIGPAVKNIALPIAKSMMNRILPH